MKLLLAQSGILTPADIDEIIATSSTRWLEKGEYFAKVGRVCNEVAFIKSGILRSFHTNEEGDELTYCITFPDNFMTAYSSFITGAPSVENIQAVIPTELIILKKSDIDRRAEQHISVMKYMRFIAEQHYLALEQRVFSLQKENAKARYKELLSTQPQYLQQIPLQYLASYLAITPRHLSRLRKEGMS